MEVETTGERRKFGTLKGKIWMAPDFHEWPEDTLATFEAPLFEPEPVAAKWRYTLDEPLKGITDENQHESFDNGPKGEEEP